MTWHEIKLHYIITSHYVASYTRKWDYIRKEMHTHTCILYIYIYAHGYSSWYNYNSYAYAHNTQYTSIQNTQYAPTHTHPWYAYGRMDFLLHSKQLVDKNAKCELVRIKEEEHTTSQLVQTTLAMVKNCKPYQSWRLTSATFDKPVTSLGWYPAHHPFLVPTGCNAPGADVIDICVEAWTEIWGHNSRHTSEADSSKNSHYSCIRSFCFLQFLSEFSPFLTLYDSLYLYDDKNKLHT